MACIPALALLTYFEAGPPIAFNDDWMFTWTVRQLAQGHGLKMVPDQAPLGLVQVLLGLPVILAGGGIPQLRTLSIPFLLLAALLVYRVGRDIGAARFWSATAAATLLCSPLVLSLATTFMSDVIYLGILMASVWFGLRWVLAGEGRLGCVICTGLAFLERQQGAAMVVAVSLGLLLARRERAVGRRDWGWLATLWIVVLALVAGVARSGSDAATGTRLSTFLTHPQVYRLLGALIFLGIMLGVLAIPFLGALLAAPPRNGLGRGSTRWTRRITFALGSAAVITTGVLAVLGQNGFPGDYLNPAGLGPPHVVGGKVPMVPAPAYLLFEALAAAGAILVFVRHHGSWTPGRLGLGGTFLVLVAGLQLLPFAQTEIIDRYYLPVVVPVLPLIARAAGTGRVNRAAAASAVASVLVLTGLYAFGEQDYQAWQAARDAAARLAFQRVPPDRVQAGWEANAVYVELPGYERTGVPHRLSVLDAGGLPSMVGPAHPIIVLRFAGPNDPRPGVRYSSVAPGKIVLAGP